MIASAAPHCHFANLLGASRRMAQSADCWTVWPAVDERYCYCGSAPKTPTSLGRRPPDASINCVMPRLLIHVSMFGGLVHVTLLD